MIYDELSSDRKTEISNIPEALETEYTKDSENFQPWIQRSLASDIEQKAFQELLRQKSGAQSLGSSCFISPKAQVHTSYFSLGANSWVAAGAIIRGNVTIGENSSVNPYAHIAGQVIIGNGVRIAGSVSIYGFNHGHQQTDVWIYEQPHTSIGIVIGDGTWIGANAVVVDGVQIGAHCIVAAGAVVTKNVEDYSVVGGNPASLIRNRKETQSTAISTKIRPILPVRQLLYNDDPYTDVPFKYDKDLQGWDSHNSIFNEVIRSVKPKLIVEVGTWKGASAIHMASICRSIGLQTEIVCNDTWLGNWQHWSRGEGGVGSRADLKIFNGLPRLYYQFLSNVIHCGFEDMITPLPLTGVAGAKLFEHFRIMPDLIYIDGDHEYESVLFDLKLWIKQLSPRGVLIGDDYVWPGVKRAVSEIMATESLVLRVVDQKFTLSRPLDQQRG